MTIAAADPTEARAALITQAFWLEQITILWMLIEAGVAITVALAAHSISLLAFGIDSLIELISAGVLIWRLTVELRHGRAFSERAERQASRIGGLLLFTLAVYVVVSAAWGLWKGEGEAFTVAGLMITALAIPVMLILARRKLTIAGALGSGALRADAMESITCGWLSFVVLAGLVTEGLIGAWWIDPVISLGIVWLLVKEGREAWAGEGCCDHGCH